MDGFSEDFQDMLTNQATIQRFTLVDSANGGSTKSFGNVKAGCSFNLPCSIQPVSGDKSLFAAKLNIVVTHNIIFNQVLALQNGDQLVDSTGRKFQIQYWADEGGLGEVFEILALLITE